eukprot:1254751-Heterocapsa_arctica.AAC.1
MSAQPLGTLARHATQDGMHARWLCSVQKSSDSGRHNGIASSPDPAWAVRNNTRVIATASAYVAS